MTITDILLIILTVCVGIALIIGAGTFFVLVTYLQVKDNQRTVLTK